GVDIPAEAALVDVARHANDDYVSLFDANRSAAGTQDAERVVAKLNAAEPKVTGPIDQLRDTYAKETDAFRGAVASANNQALIAALIGTLLAIGGGIAFAVYALRLVGRIAAREAELQRTVEDLAERELQLKQTVESLSDRDELLERIRTTS